MTRLVCAMLRLPTCALLVALLSPAAHSQAAPQAIAGEYVEAKALIDGRTYRN
jgi:hypothetical protein